MKIVKIILFFNLFSCHNTNKTENPRLVYDNYVHYFGEVPFKNKAEYDFCYINRGCMSLSIKFVKMNCGCLNSKWSGEIIRPNEKGKITIQKDTGIPGNFVDRILVYYNESDLPDTLIINGKVIYP